MQLAGRGDLKIGMILCSNSSRGAGAPGSPPRTTTEDVARTTRADRTANAGRDMGHSPRVRDVSRDRVSCRRATPTC